MTADDCENKTYCGIKVEMPSEPEPELDAHQKVRMECLRLAVMRTDNANALKAVDLAREYESYVNCGFGLSEMVRMEAIADANVPENPNVYPGPFRPYTPPAPPSQSPT